METKTTIGMLGAAACLLAACGGAGTTTQAPAPFEPVEVIFRDEFDRPTTSGDDPWSVSGDAPAADAPPSSLGLGEAEATAEDHAFRLEGEPLEFAVRLAWPGDCAGPGATRSRPIQLVEERSGLVLASLVVEIQPGCDEVRLEYRVDPTGSLSTSSYVGLETHPLAGFADRFHEYVLLVYPDGRARWMRDGLTLITSFAPLADEAFLLRLGGRAGPGEPVLYDAVEVRRP